MILGLTSSFCCPFGRPSCLSCLHQRDSGRSASCPRHSEPMGYKRGGCGVKNCGQFSEHKHEFNAKVFVYEGWSRPHQSHMWSVSLLKGKSSLIQNNIISTFVQQSRFTSQRLHWFYDAIHPQNEASNASSSIYPL